MVVLEVIEEIALDPFPALLVLVKWDRELDFVIRKPSLHSKLRKSSN